MTITEFLEARIAEDEAAARDRPASAHIHQSGCYYYDYSLDANWFCDCDEDGTATARVLGECAAKRAIMTAHQWYDYDVDHPEGACVNCRGEEHDEWYREQWPCTTVKALAAVYKDHPDYQQEWA